jgi:hypothetical protein
MEAPQMDLVTDIKIRSLKLLDITMITIAFSILCIGFSKWLDVKIGKFDKEDADNKKTIKIFLEILANISIIAIAGYIARNIVGYIPFPFDGLYGYQHSRVKELGGGTVFGFTLFLYQTNLRQKIDYFINRVFPTEEPKQPELQNPTEVKK